MQVSFSNLVNNLRPNSRPLSTPLVYLKSCPKRVLNLLGLMALVISPASLMAQEIDDWWFDVEVIAFKRNTASAQLEEDFASATYAQSTSTPIDLLSLPLYKRANPLHDLKAMLYECSFQTELFVSALPDINASNETVPYHTENTELDLLPVILSTEDRFTLLFDSLNCSEQKNAIANNSLLLNEPMQVPVYLQQPVMSVSEDSHLLDDAQLNLLDYAKKLFGQRNITPLAHFAWRQPVVFGEEEASFYRVFSGDKLILPALPAPSFETLKEKYEPELENVIDQNSETFFMELKQQLQQGKQVNWSARAANLDVNADAIDIIDDVWELDGIVKVYLKNINRVPYLHIESEFLFHEMKINQFGEAQIEQYPFKQRRRVISKQIHYFDHPKMGLVIRLQRYEPPLAEDEEEELDNQ